MGSTKEKIAEMEEEMYALRERKNASRMLTHKYEKTSDWTNVRLNMFSLLNAFTPEIIDNSENIKNQVKQIILEQIEEEKERLESLKESNLDITASQVETSIITLEDILIKIEEWI